MESFTKLQEEILNNIWQERLFLNTDEDARANDGGLLHSICDRLHELHHLEAGIKAATNSRDIELLLWP